jgi:large conductance mechanosensitive channel
VLKEFREFIAKGNMLDLAIGIVIGAAFTAIIGSFVKDLVTPLIGLFGKANFENVFLVLKDGTNPRGPYTTPDVAAKAGAVTLNYGSFLTAVINFLIVAFVLFLIVKAANRMKRKEEEAVAADPEIPNDEKLLIEIRDLLKSRTAS